MKSWTFWLRLIVSVATCLFIFWWLDWSEVGDMIKTANLFWLIAVFVSINLDRFFMAYKWNLLLKDSDASVPMTTAVKAYYVSSLWSFFLPSSVGPDAVRAIWLSKKGQDSATIISSVVIERLFGAFALTIVALGGLALSTLYFDLRSSALFTIIFFLCSKINSQTSFSKSESHN
jgi:uncharacterized protein (TIRG00374 family)